MVACCTHILIDLPDGVDDVALATTAATVGIGVQPLSPLHVAPGAARGLLLGYGRLTESRIEAAIRELARLVAAALQPHQNRPGHAYHLDPLASGAHRADGGQRPGQVERGVAVVGRDDLPSRLGVGALVPDPHPVRPGGDDLVRTHGTDVGSHDQIPHAHWYGPM